MGADFLTATIIAPRGGTVATKEICGFLIQRTRTLTAGHFREVVGNTNLNALFDEFVDVMNERGLGDDAVVPQFLVDKIVAEVMDTVNDLSTSLFSRDVTNYPVSPTHALFLAGGMSWGDSPNDACDHIWQVASLIEDLYGSELGALLDVSFIGTTGRLRVLDTPNEVIAEALVQSQDPEVRLAAATDAHLPLTASQVEALAHDADPRVATAAAQRVAASLR